MATIMERDVLIESAAFTQGVLWRQNKKRKATEDFKKDDELVDGLSIKYLYSKAEDLDWEKEVQLMKDIREKYGE